MRLITRDYGTCTYTGLLPSFLSHTVQKMGREPGRFHQVYDDVLCVVLVIELLPVFDLAECHSV